MTPGGVWVRWYACSCRSWLGPCAGSARSRFAIPGGRVGRGIGRVSLGVGFAERLVALEVVAVRVLAGGDASPGVIADLPGDLDAAGSQLLDGRL